MSRHGSNTSDLVFLNRTEIGVQKPCIQKVPVSWNQVRFRTKEEPTGYSVGSSV